MLQLKIQQIIRITKSVAFAHMRRIFLLENLSQTLSNLSPQLNKCKIQAATILTADTEHPQEGRHLMILTRLVAHHIKTKIPSIFFELKP